MQDAPSERCEETLEMYSVTTHRIVFVCMRENGHQEDGTMHVHYLPDGVEMMWPVDVLSVEYR